jgi:hypothetical protein
MKLTVDEFNVDGLALIEQPWVAEQCWSNHLVILGCVLGETEREV